MIKETGEKFYRFKYKFSIDDNNGKGWNKEEMDQGKNRFNDVGACDAIMFVSVLKNNGDAALDCLFFPIELSDNEIFNTWALLGGYLLERNNLRSFQYSIISEAVEKIRDYITEAKKLVEQASKEW